LITGECLENFDLFSSLLIVSEPDFLDEQIELEFMLLADFKLFEERPEPIRPKIIGSVWTYPLAYVLAIVWQSISE